MIPSENYIYEYFMSLVSKLASQNILLIFISNTQFLISHEDFKNIYPDKPPVMETFYRMMRRRFDILMDGDKPI
jgi:deoxyribodipyrimidine photolyase-related protein